MCPSCGFDLHQSTPIRVNDFAMAHEGSTLFFRDKPVPLSRSEAAVAWALLRACPTTVGHDALMMRIGSEAASNTLQVFVHRLRQKLLVATGIDPVITMPKRGYAWDAYCAPATSDCSAA